MVKLLIGRAQSSTELNRSTCEMELIRILFAPNEYGIYKYNGQGIMEYQVLDQMDDGTIVQVNELFCG